LTRELLSGNTDVFFAWLSNAEGELVWAEITTSEAPLRAQHLSHKRGSHVAPPHA
jgi:hypothetical protein